jgi:hypothetical protein
MKIHPLIMLPLVSLAIQSGCSRTEVRTVAVFPVDGQLLIAGKPAVGAVVTFQSTADGGTRSPVAAVVREDGHFAPTQSDGAIGLPEGEYALSLRRSSSTPPSATPSTTEETIGSITVKHGVNLIPPIRLAK